MDEMAARDEPIIARIWQAKNSRESSLMTGTSSTGAGAGFSVAAFVDTHAGVLHRGVENEIVGYVLSTDDKIGRKTSDGEFKKSRGSFRSEIDRSNKWHNMNYRVPLDAAPVLLARGDGAHVDEPAAPVAVAIRSSELVPKKRDRQIRPAEQMRISIVS